MSISGVGISIACQENLNLWLKAPRDGEHKRRRPKQVVERIQSGATLNQEFRYLLVMRHRRPMKRRHSLSVLGADQLWPLFQESLNFTELASANS